MTRIPFPPDVCDTSLRFARTLDQRTPHLRSSSVCLSTATSGDAAEVAAQRRVDRIFMGCLAVALLVLAGLMAAGVV